MRLYAAPTFALAIALSQASEAVAEEKLGPTSPLEKGASELVPAPREPALGVSAPGGESAPSGVPADLPPVGGDQSALPPAPSGLPDEEFFTDEARLVLPEHIDVVALTVSGGVSLGAYEAGQVYLLTEALRRSPGAAKLLVTAGTSAGSANAIIGGTEACFTESIEPEASLGYRVWTPVGLDQLFDPAKVTASSLFHDRMVRQGFALLEETWKKGLPESCNFAFSVAATRKESYDVEIAEGLVVPRQAERFSVHVEGRRGAVPKFTNYLDPAHNLERPLLPLSDGLDLTGEKDFRAIESTVLASGAFPIAFPPQPIPHCISAPTSPNVSDADRAQHPPTCRRPTRNDEFVDGGLFDNNPLGSSLRITERGLYLDAKGVPQFRTVPVSGPEPAPEVLHAFVDPDLTRYPQKSSEEVRAKDEPLLALLGRLSGQVLGSMRGQELATQAERNRLQLSRLWLIRSSAPPTSGLLGAFFGFFEKDFRDFDFHLGTYDTFAELRSRTGKAIGTTPYVGALENILKGPASNVAPRYRKLACISAHLEPKQYGHLAPLCGGDELRNFRALLQVSLDRLWSTCRGEDLTDGEKKSHGLCSSAQAGAPSPVVDPSFSAPLPRYQTKLESEFDYALRLLETYDFEFKDLGLKRGESKKARLFVRRKLDSMVMALAKAQPSLTDRTLIMTAGRTTVNGIAYEPPVHRFYAQFGGSLAVGYLGRLAETSSFFVNPDLRFANIADSWTDVGYSFNMTPSLGLEYIVLPLSGSYFQFSVGARAGYHFSAGDNLGTKTCEGANVNNDPRNCSQFVIHTPVNFSLLERVRLTATPHFFPIAQSFDHRVFGFELGIGAELF